MEKQQGLPEYIQGLATKKSEAQQRREIVEKEYLKLLDRLAKKSGKNKKNYCQKSESTGRSSYLFRSKTDRKSTKIRLC
jgi:hypothetical protein